MDLSQYSPALLALGILCLSVLLQALLTAPLAFAKGEQLPGQPLIGDHNLLSFRVIRTQANSVESLGPFGFALILAILLDVSPQLINWLAGIHVGFRIGFWIVYYLGVGKVAGGPRTLCFIGGLASNLVLVGLAISALVL